MVLVAHSSTEVGKITNTIYEEQFSIGVEIVVHTILEITLRQPVSRLVEAVS